MTYKTYIYDCTENIHAIGDESKLLVTLDILYTPPAQIWIGENQCLIMGDIQDEFNISDGFVERYIRVIIK